jgi:hypothetical protein
MLKIIGEIEPGTVLELVDDFNRRTWVQMELEGGETPRQISDRALNLYFTVHGSWPWPGSKLVQVLEGSMRRVDLLLEV